MTVPLESAAKNHGEDSNIVRRLRASISVQHVSKAKVHGSFGFF